MLVTSEVRNEDLLATLIVNALENWVVLSSVLPGEPHSGDLSSLARERGAMHGPSAAPGEP